MNTAKKRRFITIIPLILLAFLIPFIIMALIYWACGMAPWGDKSVLIMDMSDQYVAFFAELRSILAGDSSMFFSWHKAFGCNFIGVYAYYLASPFSFITLLFPAEELPQALMWLTCIKIGLAGLSFALFLKLAFGKRDWAILLFSCCYALMSYSCVYSLSIMWLDGLIFLPMVMLGVERLIRLPLGKTGRRRIKRRADSEPCGGFAGEAGDLAGGFAGLACARGDNGADGAGAALFEGSQPSARTAGDFAGEAAVLACARGDNGAAGAETALVEGGGAEKAAGARGIKGLAASFPWLLAAALALMLIANYYIAYMVCVFAVLYFLLRFFAQRPPRLFWRYFWRFCAGGLLAAMLSAWLLAPAAADLLSGRLASGGSAPAGGTYFTLEELLKKLLPGQYDSITNGGLPSIYCGLCPLLGAVVFFASKKISVKEKLMSLGIIAVMLLSFIFKGLDYLWHGFAYPTWFPFRNAFLFSAFLVFIAYRGAMELPALAACARTPARVCAGILVTAVVLAQTGGLYYNGKSMIEGLDKQFGYKPLAEYEGFYQELKPLVERAEADEGFYRIEKTFERSKNDAMTFGYNGITHYSSAYNGQVNSFTRQLGFAQTHFWNSYYGSTIIPDSLFGVKYIMSRGDMPREYAKIQSSGGTDLYKNPFSLPVGFMAAGADISGRGFEAQNCMLASLSGINEEYFIECEVTGGQGEYIITPSRSGPCYMVINNAPYGWGEVYLDGELKGSYFTSETCCMLYLGDLEEGQSSILSINTNLSYAQPEVCVLDMQKARAAFEKLSGGGLTVEEYGADYINGTVQAGEGGMLFTSIPYDRGFHVTVDGKKIETFAGFDTFLCFNVPAGEHEIEINYTAPGSTAGWILSAAGLGFCLLSGGSALIIKRRGQK